LPELVAELVRLDVDVLVVATTPGALAAKKTTRVIPIVMLVVADPVGSGVVASLARPGENVTGLSLLSPETTGERLELLKETLPGISRVAVLMNPGNGMHAVFWKETQAAARRLHVQLQPIQVQAEYDFDGAIQAAVHERAEALLAFDDPLLISHRARLVALSAKRRLPMMSGLREFADAGGLMSYGASFLDQYRRTAVFVDKILKGAKPADLPSNSPRSSSW
jgi:putative ABC transport system substrate-binding protein